MPHVNPEGEQEQYVEKQIEEAREGEYPNHKDLSIAQNGSMVNDMEDLKQLGEDMDEMHTNSEDKKQGLISDPEQ
ncbi:hypothetical protein [Paenibacillus physcomitrellae]|uniref:DUF4025 domain-containing protein n=1 Tax=Paenibacillus physcomitrellae TaxID=1619311 RepID=A0ABQ1GV37_9BACL|nr:hypothetical protein [Paenibacillus physcomitrellae]GGA50528.1 hypothetical protein GCM10010917_39740 [Paenibacillus physcomitrellae]